jgi:enterochelin esterase-like enzyme
MRDHCAPCDAPILNVDAGTFKHTQPTQEQHVEMSLNRHCGVWLVATLTAILLCPAVGFAQQQQQKEQERKETPSTERERPRRGGQRGPVVVSPEVQSDRRITFRILAPKADNVRLSGSDIPGDASQRSLTKAENGVWELTLGPVDPGAYRYVFNVDDVSVVDPRSSAISQSNGNTWSVVHVPGADFMDALDVPHGAVAAVHYKSSTLGRTRRMHVYTPPGYEAGQEKYPVFYLLHGASDSDDSWTSVGRANFILDNLIAAGKAKPMIVVMPAGHTGPFSFGAPAPPSADGRPNLGAGAFENDFANDIRPYIEKHYRALNDTSNRAIAGLSMGGAQTLNIVLARLDDFGYAGVFSSGVFLRNAADWEKEHEKTLGDANAKKGLKLLWFSTGTEDFLMSRTRETVELFKKHGFEPVFKESTGGHTWINWRNYLNEFAPQLFR